MLFEIILLILGIPTGVLIAWLSRDELLVGRKWFLVLMGVSLIFGIVFFILKNFIIVLISGFIFVVSLISYWKSFDKKWTRKP